MQMEGYGVPQYANTQYPWDGCDAVEIGEIPETFNPVGSYVRTFFLPEHMKGKRVFVTFDGAESCLAVWLNGHYVGFTSDSFTPHAFELTPHLRAGENRLACRVYRYSAGSWLEDQDFIRFSGLYRDVWLYAVGDAHIEDVRVKTLLDDAYTDAVLDVRLRMLLAPAAAPGTVRLSLLDGGARDRPRRAGRAGERGLPPAGGGAPAVEQRIAVPVRPAHHRAGRGGAGARGRAPARGLPPLRAPRRHDAAQREAHCVQGREPA